MVATIFLEELNGFLNDYNVPYNCYTTMSMEDSATKTDDSQSGSYIYV